MPQRAIQPVVCLATWWRTLLRPEAAGQVVLGGQTPRGFTPVLLILIGILYCAYGVTMGLFRGAWPATVSGFKLPFLYLFTLTTCFPAFYVSNAFLGPRLKPLQCARILVLSVSANALALASYAPFSLFFVLTTSREGYPFLILMHVVAFGLAGLGGLAVAAIVFRATAREIGRSVRPAFLVSWGLLYGFVGTQTAWVLRPWLGTYGKPYQALRPISGSFLEAVWNSLQQVLGNG